MLSVRLGGLTPHPLTPLSVSLTEDFPVLLLLRISLITFVILSIMLNLWWGPRIPLKMKKDCFQQKKGKKEREEGGREC